MRKYRKNRLLTPQIESALSLLVVLFWQLWPIITRPIASGIFLAAYLSAGNVGFSASRWLTTSLNI